MRRKTIGSSVAYTTRGSPLTPSPRAPNRGHTPLVDLGLQKMGVWSTRVRHRLPRVLMRRLRGPAQR